MYYEIDGGNRLVGEIKAQGAKNSALPILCASLLCDGETVITNCPDIADVRNTLTVLRSLGCDCRFSGNTVSINTENARFSPASDEVGKMRSGSLFLGACIGKFHKAHQKMSGGCVLGKRPIDIHISAFERMGVHCEMSDAVRLDGAPHGADIVLPFPSVGATENVILASAIGRHTVTISNPAKEPEIADLCAFLNSAGARITVKPDVIVAEGVEKLHGTRYNVMGDRIECATYLCMALATDGVVTVTGVDPRHLKATTDALIECGACFRISEDSITVRRSGAFILPADIATGAYPLFPTDMQSVTCALLLKASGISHITENIFSDRFRVLEEYNKFGALTSVRGITASVRGTNVLNGATVTACDLRSGAGLVLAALSAEGTSRVYGTEHIERGYENIVEKITALGGKIRKEV